MLINHFPIRLVGDIEGFSLLNRNTNQVPLALRLGQVPQLTRLGHRTGIDAPAAVAEVEDAFLSIDSVGSKRMSTLVSGMVILENSRDAVLVEQRTPVLDELLRQRIL